MREAKRLLALLTLLSVAGPTLGARPAASLAETVAARIRSALPAYDIRIDDALTLSIAKPNAAPIERIQVNLDRIADYCARTPAGCQNEISDFIQKMIGVIRAQEFVPTTTALRAVLRPANYLAQMRALPAANGGEFVSAPFAGDLVMMCYFDMPTAMRPAMTTDVAKIGLSTEQALAICLKNTRAGLPELPLAPTITSAPGSGVINILKGDPYDSSYLLLHDDWAPLARKMGGRLMVTAPDADLVFYGEDLGPLSTDALSTLSKKAFAEAERPISTNVFRWTEKEWEVAAP